MAARSSAGSSSPVPPLPAGADLPQLANQWDRESVRLTWEQLVRVMNVALGLPPVAHQGDRSELVSYRCMDRDEQGARFELARRQLGIVPPLRRLPVRWMHVRYRLRHLRGRLRRRFRALLGRRGSPYGW